MTDFKQLPRPEPAAGLEAYEAERAACLALDVRKRENYARYLASSRRIAEVDYLPIRLDIENVSRCNFACTMCVVSTWPKGKRAEDMPLAAFKQLIDEQYGLVEIKLNGLGEALLQGDEYFEMIRYARERRIWVRITTNASLLHLRENYRKLVDSGVNEIDISIDGADAPTFEGIRVQGDFDRVTSNCKLLNDYALSVGKPSAKMWVLVQRGNLRTVVQSVKLAQDLGFRHLVYSLQMHGWGHEDMAAANAANEVQVAPHLLEALMVIGELRGVRVSFWQVNEKFSTESPEKLCPWPFQQAVVTSDLRTVPCCMIGDPDAFEIGAGSGKGFGELWQGDEYLAFRQAHLDGQIPKICRACYRDEVKQ